MVYPNHGVSVVEEISASEFDGIQHTLYHLRLLSNNSKVMVPKDNLELVGLRPLGGRDEIQPLFDILEDGNIDTYKDWKGRYKQNLDKMKTGRLPEVAEVLKNLCLVSQKKSLSFREKKMYERAKYFIISEVAHVKEIEEEEAEKVVERSLESSLEKIRRAAEITEQATREAEETGKAETPKAQKAEKAETQEAHQALENRQRSETAAAAAN
ncbi:MAG: CarD family transcriptional regulator [bacterium]|nr:CarD family transcriptional regulator [bacterium]